MIHRWIHPRVRLYKAVYLANIWLNHEQCLIVHTREREREREPRGERWGGTKERERGKLVVMYGPGSYLRETLVSLWKSLFVCVCITDGKRTVIPNVYFLWVYIVRCTRRIDECTCIRIHTITYTPTGPSGTDNLRTFQNFAQNCLDQLAKSWPDFCSSSQWNRKFRQLIWDEKIFLFDFKTKWKPRVPEIQWKFSQKNVNLSFSMWKN